MAPSSHAAASVETVDTDIACIGCGYNLRTLDTSRTCPECALPVGRSLRGDWLVYSDPTWVRMVASATWWGLAALIVGVGPHFAEDDLGLPTAWLRVPAAVVAGIMTMIAIFLFTAPERRQALKESTWCDRIVARWSAGALTGFALVALALEWLGTPHRYWLALPAVIVATIFFFVAGRHAAGLAQRVPAPWLARMAKTVGHGQAIVGPIAFLGLTLCLYRLDIEGAAWPGQPFGAGAPWSPGMHPMDRVYMACACVVGLVQAFMIWQVGYLLLNMTIQMTHAAKQARDTWARES